MGNKQVTIKIADICIGIKSQNKGWEYFCRDYMVDEEPDFILEDTETDIEGEQNHIAEYMDGAQYSSFEAEKLWIYREIAEVIPSYGSFLIHGAAVRVDENAYLFLGPSGAGKTTHARLWKECFGDRFSVINDDKPIIKLTDDEITVCGSPWSGKERWKNNIAAPLRSVVCIHQAEENRIERMPISDCWNSIMNQAYRTRDTANMKKTLDLFDKVINTTPFFSLNCRKTIDAVELAYKKLRDEIQ